MSEQKPCLYDEQKKLKPKIENVIPDYLDNETQEIVLSFVNYMRENKMVLRWAGITNAWKAMVKGKCICRVSLCALHHWEKDKKWVITPHLNYIHEYDSLIMNEGLQDIVCDGMVFCNGCPPTKGGKRPVNRPCIGGKNVFLFGREIKGLCVNLPLTRIYGPDETTINAVKRLLELEKKARNL